MTAPARRQAALSTSAAIWQQASPVPTKPPLCRNGGGTCRHAQQPVRQGADAIRVRIANPHRHEGCIPGFFSASMPRRAAAPAAAADDNGAAVRGPRRNHAKIGG
jgi:hypothetical protein